MDHTEPLLDARRRELARRGLDPGGDVHRLHGADRRHAALAHQVRNSSADRA
jgi:hypothetical protein